VPEEVVDPVGCTEVDWEGDVAPDLLAASSRGRFFWDEMMLCSMAFKTIQRATTAKAKLSGDSLHGGLFAVK